MVTFISSPISSRGKRYQPKAQGRGLIPLFEGWCGAWYESNHVIIYLSLIYYKKKLEQDFQDLSIFLFPLCQQFVHCHCARKNAFGRLHYFLLTPWTLFSYLCELSVWRSCGIDPNYVEISTKSVKDVCDVGQFDFVSSTLSMTFQGTWALILTLIRISARISARKLKY